MANTALDMENNFNSAILQAEKLEGIASRVDNIGREELIEVIDEIASYWEGQTAKQYHNKGVHLAEDVKGIALSLRRAARSMRMIAANSYSAQKNALELAASTKYGIYTS